jgi:hypothetical protein
MRLFSKGSGLVSWIQLKLHTKRAILSKYGSHVSLRGDASPGLVGLILSAVGSDITWMLAVQILERRGRVRVVVPRVAAVEPGEAAAVIAVVQVVERQGNSPTTTGLSRAVSGMVEKVRL